MEVTSITVTSPGSYFTETTSNNPWPHFGALQYFEVIYLTFVIVLGTFGNLIVILSISHERKAHSHGNIFIINLAIADLLISGFVLPTVVASVINMGNALDTTSCSIVAAAVTSSCTCSIYNLMAIAINRCWAVVTPTSYVNVFSKRNERGMVVAIWIWSVLLVVPTVFGWGGLRYDESAVSCTWDTKVDISYTIFLTIFAIFVPLIITGICYVRLFRAVIISRKRVRGASAIRSGGHSDRSMTRERRLFRTLLTTVLVFIVCWVPFGVEVMLSIDTPPHVKKIISWLALTNSSVNFIIYGILNKSYRRGYRNFLFFLFCHRRQRRRGSVINVPPLHSNSDSHHDRRRKQEIHTLSEGNH